MANRRMIHRNVSVCEQLADCSVLARLLFTWGLPHTSDWGVLAASPRRLKAQVFPISSETPDEIGSAVQELVSAGLWVRFADSESEYIYYPTFDKFQDLHQRRAKPRDGLPLPPNVEKLPEVPGSSRKSPPKRSEENRIEVKRTEERPLSGAARRKQHQHALDERRSELMEGLAGRDRTLVQAYLVSAAEKNASGKQTLSGELGKLEEILALKDDLQTLDPEHGLERWQHGMMVAADQVDKKTGVMGITVANFVKRCAENWSADGGNGPGGYREKVDAYGMTAAERSQAIARGEHVD